MKNFFEKYKYLIIPLVPLIVLVILLNPNFFKKNNYEIYLNGDYDETYLVNHYVDNGALALKNNMDISRKIYYESNIEPNKVGDYEIHYFIYGDDKEDIYEIKRDVHIVDLKLDRKVDLENNRIILNILSDLYDHTILPNGSISYNKNITYDYNEDGIYEFEIYMTKNISKKYRFKVSNFDNDGPETDCVITYNGRNFFVNVDAYDNSGIMKYVYNNQEYYVNNFSLGIDDLSVDNIVRVYDNKGNYTDKKCIGNIEKDFKEIVSSSEKSGYYSCGMDNSKANNDLNKIVNLFGYKTRNSVVASALYLTNYKYNISYTWGGKHVRFGMSPKWGCKVSVTENKCTHSLGENTCEGGLDCTGFTSWSFAQAGFSSDTIRTSSQTKGNWGNFNALSHRYAFKDSIGTVNLVKPGDLVSTEGHVGMIIGIGDDTLQIANMVGPIKISIIKKSNGQSINSQSSFDHFVLFDEYFNAYG